MHLKEMGLSASELRMVLIVCLLLCEDIDGSASLMLRCNTQYFRLTKVKIKFGCDR